MRTPDEIQNHFLLEHFLEHIYAEKKKEKKLFIYKFNRAFWRD